MSITLFGIKKNKPFLLVKLWELIIPVSVLLELMNDIKKGSMKRRGHGILGNAVEQCPICMTDRLPAARYNAPLLCQPPMTPRSALL